MAFLIAMFSLSLIFILASCLYFTNAVEWLGKKLNLGQGVIGSIFAAVGTAMPETMIPLIAIVFHKGQASDEIGVGAIVGAPFMLSTLGFFVTGASAIVYALFRKRPFKITPSLTGFQRDMSYFIIIYSAAVITSFINRYLNIKTAISIFILLSYFIYVAHTFSSKEDSLKDVDNLFFSKHFHLDTTLYIIILQLVFSLFGISYGAHIFIKYTEQLSALLGVPPAILSLIITPIATELPEKLNSILWIGQKKDTLALLNITGAMVFQSSVPVAIGMMFTDWNLTGLTMLTTVLALISSYISLIYAASKKYLSPFILMAGSIFYCIFLLQLL
ncbi:sodium:calcium antiporter [Thermoanaerobacterium thermosaccharolyticum]|uniref:sodium:calcium antiporter n=1 Tax=Thermoanaerobacterium thermosaccharolyticum TaxID=1517 RepID=UPI0020A2398C|nr:sodium:calcium antiporter [Thermoanaerobacterium thermosaccharolyticum]MCP2240966.1 cation:H+ antiporter [Thermoanaerobacterium thermosaccharolyticum]